MLLYRFLAKVSHILFTTVDLTDIMSGRSFSRSVVLRNVGTEVQLFTMTICQFFANSLPSSEIEVPVIKFLSSFHGNSIAFANDLE